MVDFRLKTTVIKSHNMRAENNFLVWSHTRDFILIEKVNAPFTIV